MVLNGRRGRGRGLGTLRDGHHSDAGSAWSPEGGRGGTFAVW